MRIIRSEERPFVPASHENPLAPGVWKKILCDRACFRPGAVQMLNWCRMPAGSQFAPHYHEDMQELFLILQGAAEITVAGQTDELRRGDAILIEPREVHLMRNRAQEDLEYLAMGISGGQGRTVVVETGE